MRDKNENKRVASLESVPIFYLNKAVPKDADEMANSVVSEIRVCTVYYDKPVLVLRFFFTVVCSVKGIAFI